MEKNYYKTFKQTLSIFNYKYSRMYFKIKNKQKKIIHFKDKPKKH